MRSERIGGAPAAKAAPAKDPDAATALSDGMDKEHAKEVRLELLLQRQRDRFDFQTEERTELEREYNTVRDMMLTQMKNDDEVVKKYIAMM